MTEEKKICDGVYFTDYRELSKQKMVPENSCGDYQKALPTFISLEKVEELEGASEVTYIYNEVLKKLKWLQDSTILLQEIGGEEDSVEENVQVGRKYIKMVQILAQKCKDLGLSTTQPKDEEKEMEKFEKIESAYAEYNKSLKPTEEQTMIESKEDEGLFV